MVQPVLFELNTTALLDLYLAGEVAAKLGPREIRPLRANERT
jgi:hypothetical protein